MRRMLGSRLTVALLALAFLISACAEEEGAPLASIQHAPIHDHECGVCGMSVAMQPAPRAQVVHRDGTRRFFCSIADWQLDMSAPSPHGRVVASFVEVLDADSNPMTSSTEPHRWVAAPDVSYVVDITRPGVMGKPVLTFDDPALAEKIADGQGDAHRVDLTGLGTWFVEDAR